MTALRLHHRPALAFSCLAALACLIAGCGSTAAVHQHKPTATQPAVSAAGDSEACRAFRQVELVLGQDNSDNELDPGGGDDAGDGNPQDMMNGTATTAWLGQQAAHAVPQIRQAIDAYTGDATAGVSGTQLTQDEQAITQACG